MRSGSGGHSRECQRSIVDNTYLTVTISSSHLQASGIERIAACCCHSLRTIDAVSGLCRSFGNGNRLNLSNNTELSISHDGLVSVLAFEGLVVDDDKCLLTGLIHIGDSCEHQFGSRNNLCHAFFEGNGSRYVLNSLFECCTNLHHFGYVRQFH